MITKHEAAHRFAEIMLNKLENPLLVQTNERMVIISENAFKLADAMQAESEKCECKERPEVLKKEWQPDTYPEYEHGRDYPSDAWVTFNGEARLAVFIKKDSLRKRPQ